MQESEAYDESDESLLSELQVIEAQPLASRALGYDAVYEKLLTKLKDSDVTA